MRGLDTFMKFMAITKYAAGIWGSAAPQTAEGAPMEAPHVTVLCSSLDIYSYPPSETQYFFFFLQNVFFLSPNYSLFSFFKENFTFRVTYLNLSYFMIEVHSITQRL